MSAPSTLSTRLVAAVAAAVALAGLVSGVASAQIPDYAGRPIVELVEALREGGQRIVYGRELLPARLRVTVSPTAGDRFEALGQILAPHGLDLERGPRETWLIIARTDLEAPAPEAPGVPRPSLVPPALETIVVTASRYPIEREAAVSSSSFGRRALETTPALGQDPMRVTHRLPGVSSNQLSSRMHIRGGGLDEVLVLLDGVRLYSPYHLKDFQNVFSGINPRVIDSMDVRTGGYEARYGDRMSGVIDMHSVTPTEYRRHELAASLLDTTVLSSGLFSEGRGAWLTSLRRGNLDVLAEAGDSDIGTPQYVDFFNKLQFTLSSRIELEAGLLSLDDKISLRDGTEAMASADYDDAYYWVTLSRSGESGLESAYRIVSTRLKRGRNGRIEDPARVTASLAETSRFDRKALTAEWSYRLPGSLWISWGAEFAATELRRRFESSRASVFPVAAPMLSGASAPPADAAVNPSQRKRAVHASLRYQPIPRIATEIGLRWDEQSLTAERQLSPRLNLRFDITPRTRISAAWGEYAQSDSLAELALADGLGSPMPARESRHTIVALEHAFGDSGLLRVEAYKKKSDRTATRFENLFEPVSLVPELLPDRFRIEASSVTTRGIELGIEGRAGSFSWWANAALARAHEHLASGSFPRSWQERRAYKAGGEWSGPRWTLTASLGYRSGWPISSARLVGGTLTVDGFNAVRLPDFSSVDLRAGKRIDTRAGMLEWFVEISNVADHANYCCLDYSVQSGAGGDQLIAEYDELIGIVPNLGIRWQF